MKVLDCTTIETTFKSLSVLFKTDVKSVKNFIENNEYRLSRDGEYWSYDALKIEDILGYFNLYEKEIIPEKVVIFHITSTPTLSNFRDYGVLNLKSALENELFSSFFSNAGVKINYDENSPPLICYQEETFEDTLLFNRFFTDACVNGFLINEDAEDNPNITHIRNCPEFIHDISRLIKMPGLVEQWQRIAKSMKISMYVDFEDLNHYEPAEYVLKAVEYILFKNKYYWSPRENYIVYLKENINVPPENIIRIDEIKRVHL